MKANILTLILFFCTVFPNYAQFSLHEKAAGNYYLNPVIPGMNPDPSICRAGEDYYMVTSTFGFFPGLPVYHSKDLVNWKLIGYGINRPGQLALRESEKDELNLFAATIRYHNGIFYIINTNTGRRSDPRNFVITATNPAGPWSEAHYIENAPRIDPSLFFDDDGKVYYTGNCIPENPAHINERTIWTQEINPETWELVGERVDVLKSGDYHRGLILAGHDIRYLNHFEGPHIYKKDGIYYLLVSHGGTSWDHAVSIWKSKNVLGPYDFCEKNPIVTNRDFHHTAYLHHTGHADIIQTHTGEWWMVLLATRPYGGEFTNMGRETALVPVDWSGVWPIVNPQGPIGKVMLTHRRPNLLNHPWPKEEIRDNFSGKELNLNWNTIQTPVEKWWWLGQPEGQLKIKVRPEIIYRNSNPSFLGRRQAHKNFTAITKMSFTPKTDNEQAGLVVTRDVSNMFQLVCTIKNGQKYIQLIRKEVVDADGPILDENGEMIAEKSAKIIAEKPVRSEWLYLKMDALEQQFSFSFSEDGKNWETLASNKEGGMLSFGLWTGRFTGTFIGMYATSNGKKSENHVLFDWFEYDGY